MKKTKIDINLFGVLSFFILFFLNGEQAFKKMMLCAIVHEAGHFCALALCGVKADSISLGVFNFNIKYNKLKTSYRADILISSAGIIFNLAFSLLAFVAGNKDMATVNICMAAVNLLPIKSLDGGNILSSIASVFEGKEKICNKYNSENVGKIKLYSKIFSPVFLCAFAVLTGFNVSVTFSSALLLMCEGAKNI